ncbi:hypothetical protein EV421DRAFT_2044861 [Armillaria borealis]|uniref:Uncharacterized protein n=1 Tax=Armillaria borealis TaxID=47425 RepID=A0AA39IEC4_9AGAR|nr:hypothetical protein EV421DRAFT_2044861 [Armillaria borealis]
MAILVCQVCDAQQTFAEFYHPYSRDSLGRIVKEGPWTFDPETGRCVRDETKLYARPDPYDCDICWDDAMVVYSTEPPPGAYGVHDNAECVNINTGDPEIQGPT